MSKNPALAAGGLVVALVAAPAPAQQVVTDPGATAAIEQGNAAQSKQLQSLNTQTREQLGYAQSLIRQGEQELSKWIERIKLANDTVRYTRQIYNLATDAKAQRELLMKQFRGIYNRAKRVQDGLKEFEGQMETIGTSDFAVDQMPRDPKYLFRRINNQVEEDFGVPLYGSKKERYEARKKRWGAQQKNLGRALKSAEAYMAQLKVSNERLGELAAEIDKSENIKSSSDLTNRLLVELRKGQAKQTELLSQLVRVHAQEKYMGGLAKKYGAVQAKAEGDAQEAPAPCAQPQDDGSCLKPGERGEWDAMMDDTSGSAFGNR